MRKLSFLFTMLSSLIPLYLNFGFQICFGDIIGNCYWESGKSGKRKRVTIIVTYYIYPAKTQNMIHVHVYSIIVWNVYLIITLTVDASRDREMIVVLTELLGHNHLEFIAVRVIDI